VEALQWILSQRAPGRWAILPKLSVTGPAEPLLAMYEPQARAALEGLGRRSVFAPRRLLPMIPVATPCPPHHLHTAWRNINTLQELAAIER
jgi:molybdopterin-guanine dinucleotide biosynthesis protein A